MYVHQQTTEGEEAITSRECQCCWRAEGDSELRATLTLQREWRKMAARVSDVHMELRLYVRVITNTSVCGYENVTGVILLLCYFRYS